MLRSACCLHLSLVAPASPWLAIGGSGFFGLLLLRRLFLLFLGTAALLTLSFALGVVLLGLLCSRRVFASVGAVGVLGGSLVGLALVASLWVVSLLLDGVF